MAIRFVKSDNSSKMHKQLPIATGEGIRKQPEVQTDPKRANVR